MMGNAFGHSILETTKFRWTEDQDIKHFVLTVLQEEGSENLRFQAIPVPTSDAGEMPHAKNIDEMGAYAIGQADLPRPNEFMPSPLDLHGIDDQCWVLIRLDPAVNWQFTKGEKPCTLKKEDLRGSNISLRHVFAKDRKVYEDEVLHDGCRTIFLGVVQRAGHESCAVNLNIEFVQGGERLQIIVDPDVPNDGNDAFPA
jgi:hypothetical protein